MKQSIRLTSNTPLPLAELVAEALANETRVAESNIRQVMGRLAEFEARYSMRSEQFEERYQAGELEQEPDWEEWLVGIRALERLIEQSEALKGIKIEEE